MKALKIYQCLGDRTRLRILNLLADGPLCVGHLAEVLRQSQPKISRHLRLLRESGAVESARVHHWMVCRLPREPAPLLAENLRCLKSIRANEAVLVHDIASRDELMSRLAAPGALPDPLRRMLGPAAPSKHPTSAPPLRAPITPSKPTQSPAASKSSLAQDENFPL